MTTQTVTNETLTPAERWSLTEVARVEVDGETYVVVDDGTYRTAQLGGAFDAETSETDYSAWCAANPGVGDEDLCARIATVAEIPGVVTAGSCRWVAAVSTDRAADFGRKCAEGWIAQTDDGEVVELTEPSADDYASVRGELGRAFLGDEEESFVAAFRERLEEESDEVGASYCVSYRDEAGVEHEVSGETLQEIQTELDDAGYEGRLTVHKDNGEVLGWVGGPDGWRYA